MWRILSPKLYLSLFNSAYSKELNGIQITEDELPEGERIVDRLNRYLKSKALVLRPSGGFNHYFVANHLASNPSALGRIDSQTLDRFELLFQKVNELLDE